MYIKLWLFSSSPSAQEFMKFTSQIVVERTQPGLRQSVKEKGTVSWLNDYVIPRSEIIIPCIPLT